MLLTRLCTNEEVHRYQKSIVVNFCGKKTVLSTSPHNGGLREDLTAAFNNDCIVGAGIGATLRAPTYQEHMALLCRELGLNEDKTVGISTAAQMENVSIKTESYKDITVTAIVTGGVEINGGRAGDPATWDELEKKQLPVPHKGTINIMLFINVNLTPGALVRSLVTCTEAKTAALQELAAPSRYSTGLATGSGTDGTIIVAHVDSPITLDQAGKHCKLGELIGRAVKAAVKEALYLQTGLCSARQHNALCRTERYGVTAQSLWQKTGIAEPAGLKKAHFYEDLELLRSDEIVSETSLYVHLMDQVDWGLLSPEEGLKTGARLLHMMGLPEDDLADSKARETSSAILVMAQALENGFAAYIAQNGVSCKEL